MSVASTTLFNIERLRRYDGPGWFLGAGFLLGLVFFLVWLHGRPDTGTHALHARGNGVVGMEAPDSDPSGVLGDITGGARPGSANNVQRGEDFFEGEADENAQADPDAENVAEDGVLAPDPGADQGVQDADAMAMGPDVGATPNAEGALTDSLLGPPPGAAPSDAAPADAAPSAPGGNLRSWYVEVEVAPGQVQMLQLNAESPEHALAILRDFRGNPRVLRGPSPEPLP